MSENKGSKMKKVYKPLIPGTLPEDLYLSIFPRNATEAELWQGYPAHINGPRRSGCLALDRFALLCHQHMHAITIEQMSNELNVQQVDLGGMVRAITGINIIEWRERYIVLALRELLTHREFSMQQICRKLGYSRNGLFQLMQRYHIAMR